jgi:hypothetical protein
MIDINKRVFGNQIPNEVREVLETRKQLSRGKGPNEELEVSTDMVLNFDGEAELSSRTPFIRMWTAIAATQGNSTGGIIYEVGNNIYNNLRLDEQFGNITGNSTRWGANMSEILPMEFELNKNDFLRYPAAIKSLTSETKGTLGITRETTIEFVVHNIYDYNNIYSVFFTKPGAQIFVDYGWDTAKLYDTKDIVSGDSLGISKLIYGDNGAILGSRGDLNVVYGVVTDFTVTPTTTDSFDISLTILSKNTTILNSSLVDGYDDAKQTLIKLLDIKVIDYAARFFIDPNTGAPYSFLIDGWIYLEDKETYINRAKMFASLKLSGAEGNITENELLSGVYWQTTDDGDPNIDGEDSVFISWGLFEDLILNAEFGVGTDIKTILEGKNFEGRFDSSQSLIRYNRRLVDKQNYNENKELSAFLYPPKHLVVGDDAKTFNTITNKSVEYKYDTASFIPMRELFVKVSVIKHAISTQDTLRKALAEIFRMINLASNDVFSLKLMSGDLSDSVLSVIDQNSMFTKAEESDNFNDMFVFELNSPNSLVKDYSFSYSLGGGDLQSMYAIQGASANNTFFPTNNMIDKFLTMKGALYQPDEGIQLYNVPTTDTILTHKTDRILVNMDMQHEYINRRAYDDVNFIKEIGNLGELTADELGLIIPEKDKTPIQNESISAEDKEDIIKDERELYAKNDMIINENLLLPTTIDSYFEDKINENFILNDKSTYVGIEFSMDIYGISSLSYGDVFRIDHLPERYSDMVYFQITGISDDVSTSGWTTKLTTIMRLRSNIKKNNKKLMVFTDITYIYISKVVLSNIIKGNSVNNKFIYKLVPIPSYFKNIKYAFTFESAEDGTFENNTGRDKDGKGNDFLIPLTDNIINAGVVNTFSQINTDTIEDSEVSYGVVGADAEVITTTYLTVKNTNLKKSDKCLLLVGDNNISICHKLQPTDNMKQLQTGFSKAFLATV